MCKTNVYVGIKENQTPSEEYLRISNYLIKRNIILGGLRLSQVIIDLYGTNNDAEEKYAFL